MIRYGQGGISVTLVCENHGFYLFGVGMIGVKGRRGASTGVVGIHGC